MVNDLLLFAPLEFLLVEFRVRPVSGMDLFLEKVPVLHERGVLLLALVLQNFQLVLQNLDSLLQLREILGGVLNQIHVLVSG